MGQKVNPIGIRLGITRQHDALWYAEGRNYTEQLICDVRAREFLKKELANATVGRVVISRQGQEKPEITIHAARPGLIIGKKGETIDKLRTGLAKIMKVREVELNIEEIAQPDLNASLVAQNVAHQLKRRVMYRRAMKRAVQTTMAAGAIGVRVQVSGRLGGAEIARSEWYREGRVPLHTFRADIDYAIFEAKTTYGIIGVKVWIFRGEKSIEKSQNLPGTVGVR